MRVLVLPGTAASQAPEHRLAFEAARLLALANATVTVLNLADYPLPLLDVGATVLAPPPPLAARQLAERIAEQDALLLVSPDANGSVPPLAKNAIDWAAGAARTGERPLRPFRGLVVGLASASPGPANAFPVLAAWRQVFSTLEATVIAAEARMNGDADDFARRDRLAADGAADRLEAFVAALLDHAETLARHAP